MRNTAKTVAAGACTLALAALLASPAFAETRPRHDADRHQGSAGARDSRGSGRAVPRAEGRSDRGSGRRPADVERRRGDSSAPQWNSRARAPRTPAPRVDGRARPAPQPVPQWQNRSRDSRGDRDRDRWRPSPQERTPRAVPDHRDPRWRADSRYDSRQRPGSRYDSRQDSHWRSGSRYDSRQDSHWRSGSRYDSRYGTRYDDRRDFGRHDGSRRMSFEGRVQRLERGHGGYHFWLDNCREPFWIPDARFLLWPLRVGLSITFGGYWDSAGYYSVYDSAPYGGSYYYGSRPYAGSYYYGARPVGGAYSATQFLQGVVAGYDDRSGTIAVRDDRTGSYVNVVLRSNELDLGYLRAGDWVSLSGVWTRDGYFEAYRVEDLRQR